MKTSFFFFMISLMVFSSCSDDVLLLSPTGFSYATTIYEVGFYETGQSGVAQITWNGETGTFGLADSYPGVSINSTTGQLSWNQDLNLGTTVVTIIATNSIGNISTTINLVHKFSGSFTGGYNYNPSSTTLTQSMFNLTFNENGTMTATDSGDNATGTYTIQLSLGNAFSIPEKCS